MADPHLQAARDNWKQAEQQGHPATRLAALSRIVTLIDACPFGTDWVTWDKAGKRDSWIEQGDDCAAARNVKQLLAEQVEAADLLLVNKVDLAVAGREQVGVASGVAQGLNDRASVPEVEFGRVDARELLGRLIEEEEEEQSHSSRGHDHEHAAEHDHEASTCAELDCTDTSHSHSHERNTRPQNATIPAVPTRRLSLPAPRDSAGWHLRCGQTLPAATRGDTRRPCTGATLASTSGSPSPGSGGRRSAGSG